MKDIAIFGAGGFGREVACLINSINEHLEDDQRWHLIGFFDDVKEKGCETGFGPVLGNTEDLNKWPTPLSVAISTSNPQNRKQIAEKVTNPNISYPNLITPDITFYDKKSVVFGKGNIVCSHCLFSCNVSVGDFNIFNNYITVGHDDKIGTFNSIMPAVRLSGNVTIGNCNFLGVSSIILQSLKIGHDTVIGAGSVIMRKTKDGCTYVGNPAKKIEY
jgi:sugar O-acyltransferase (sialic acid O-acetyltransferase NeuD family)